MKNENKKTMQKQDLLIIDAETGLLSHPSTLECVSPNSGILFPNLFGASSERITLYMLTPLYSHCYSPTCFSHQGSNDTFCEKGQQNTCPDVNMRKSKYTYMSVILNIECKI